MPEMTPYHDALLACGQRYRLMLRLAKTPEADPLMRFLEEYIDGCETAQPDRKLCRWLGYIQRDVIARGLTTVEAERDWTRPLFRPLDFPDEA